MTRKSKREIENAIEGMDTGATSDDTGEVCEECGYEIDPSHAGAPTSDFVHLGCTCDPDLPEGAMLFPPENGKRDS